MKVRILTLAVLAALAANTAYALSPSQIDTARTGGTLRQVWLSGSSSSTRNVFEAIRTDCVGGNIDTYSVGGGVPGSVGDFLAYSCDTTSHALGGPSLVYRTVAGGSFNAFAPHVIGTQLMRLRQIGGVGGNACVDRGANAFGGNDYSCPTTLNPIAAADVGPDLPDGGFSDVESALFQDLYSSPVDLFTSPVNLVGTEVFANVGQVFGVAVSTNLYRALQTRQGLTAADCNNDTYVITPAVPAQVGPPPVAAVPAFGTYTQNGRHDFRDPACVPNITIADYTSIVASGGGYQTDWQPLLGAAGANRAMNLCRRVSTSGSQASSNAYFLRFPCNRGSAGGQLAPIDAAGSTTTNPNAPSGIRVTESRGTTDVKRCLNAANDINDSTPTQYFAIGVMSLENDPFTETATDREDYRFIKLDNWSPENPGNDRARQNAINGGYNFAMELSTYTANTASANGATMITAIVNNLGDPGNVNLRGLFVSPAGGATRNLDSHSLTIVHKGTKFGQNCAPWNLFF